MIYIIEDTKKVGRFYFSKYIEILYVDIFRCQDMFARKANTEKKTRASTHLVCPIPEGDKYNAAVRWKLPAVTADWLKTCADQLTLADETPFLVGETMGKLVYTYISYFTCALFFKFLYF